MASSRTVLDRARANGYLDATHPSRDSLMRDHGFWCWKLRIPLVCFERATPRARNGRVSLDLFTTPYALTTGGVAELSALADKLQIPARVTMSRHDAIYVDVPRDRLEDLARIVLRTATRYGNFELRPTGHSPE